MRHRLSFLLTFLLICHFSFSQTERWQVYPAYTEAVQVEAAGNSIYAVMKGSGTINSITGNLVRYDIEDGSVKTYDCLHDLSDKEIEYISYNKASARLVVVYANGNIDLLDSDDNVYNISALKDKSILGEEINGISHVDEKVFLCVNIGVIEIDAKEAIINETYKSIDGDAYSVAELDGTIYASTSKGLFKFPVGSNMHDKALWQRPISQVVYTKLAVHSSHLFGCKLKGADEIGLDGTPLSILESALSYFLSVDDKLIFGVPTRVFIYEGEYTSRWKNIQVTTSVPIKGITCDSDMFYLANGIEGLNSCIKEENQFVEVNKVFAVNSPRSDLFYNISYVNNRLLVAGGVNTQEALYYPVTFMFMDESGTETRWTLFDEITPKTEYPKLSHYNGVNLVQDPLDNKHFYGAVYRNGLHEYRMDESGEVKFVGLYNCENSPLRSIDIPTSNPWNYSTCTALQYDKKGNLWMANQQTDTIVRIIRPDGKWVSLFYPEIALATNVYQYLFSSHDINFMVSYQGEPRGFFGFDTNGTLNIVNDDRHLLRTSITNQDGKTVFPNQFFCMTEDKDRQIWCGTNEGLFVITQPEEWFEDDFRFHQIKRNRNDGSGFADYLLSGVNVTCIAVDPSNRKWIGTMEDGVYLVSHDGQETIHHFTAADSPLLSNHINCIAINPNTGKVMIGTDLGLCSYDEQVTKTENFLSKENIRVYPNPVRPSTNAIVTIDGLADQTEVKILSSSGYAVWSETSVGGSVRWNCCDMSGNRVSSGVYHVVCSTTDSAQTIVSRIIVLK